MTLGHWGRYCLNRPEDEACLLFVPRFTRERDVEAEISVHLAGLTGKATTNLRFVPSYCECGGDCAVSATPTTHARAFAQVP